MGRLRSVSVGLALLAFSLAILGLSPNRAAASTGINSDISFEGKIVTAAGINIPNGTYNMEFKIYSAATACTPSTGSGCTLAWTEDWLVGSNGVTFNSGTYQVNLGSICPFSGGTCEGNTNTAINWDTYPLYLSLQIGSTTACTPAGNFTANCGGDTEMKPYILLTSSPYALNSNNSNELGGLTAGSFGQIASPNTFTAQNIFQSATNAAGIFQVQNAVGSSILSFGTTGSDLITYSGFDAGSFTSDSAGWQAIAPGMISQNAVSADSYNGGNSLELSTTTAGGGAQTNVFTQTVAAGTYALSFYVEPSVAMNANAFTITLNDGTAHSCSPASETLSTTGFRQIGCSVTTTGNLAYVTIAQNDTTARTIYIDGANLISGAALAEYSQGTESITGLITSPLNLEAASNSEDAFDIYQASGTNLLDADTLDDGIGIGLSGNPGALLSVGGTTGNFQVASSGTVTLAAGDSYTSSGALSVTSGGATNLTIDTGGAAQLSLGGTNATTVNVGSTALATGTQTIDIGYSATTGGTTNVNIGAKTGATAGTTAIYGLTNITGTTAGTVTLTGGTGTAVALVSGAAGTIEVGDTSQAESIDIGSTALATGTQTTDIGYTATTGGTSNVNIGAEAGATGGTTDIYGDTAINSTTAGTITLTGGTGTAVALVSGAAGTINVGNTSQAETVNVGSTALATGTQTIDIGYSATTGGTTNVNIGAKTGATAGTTAIYGLTNITGTTAGTVTLTGGTGTAVALVSGAAGTIEVGDTSQAESIDIGSTALATGTQTTDIGYTATTGGTSNVNIGAEAGATGGTTDIYGDTAINSTTAGTITLTGGTGTAVALVSGAAGTINVGNTSQAETVNVGSTALATGTQTTDIGYTDTAGGTSNVNIGAESASTGGTTDIYGTTAINGTTAGTVTLTGGTGTAIALVSGAAGTINVGNTSQAETVNVGSTALATGTQTIDIGYSATAGGTTDVNIGAKTGATAGTTAIYGDTGITLDTGVAADTITLGATYADDIIIGSNSSSNTTQHLLQLNSVDTFTEAATCSTTTNQGALYFNTVTNAIRACDNGAWEDVVTTAGLGIMLYGVVPDSGTVPGDLEATSTANVSGPCKVSWASATSVTVQACTLYSGGRKVVQAAVTITLPAMTASEFTHLCYYSGGAPLGPLTNATTWFTTASATETANLPAFSAGSPVECLATIKNSTTTANTIGQIFDTRVFTISQKQFVNTAVAMAPGWLAITDATNTTEVTDSAAAATKGVAGVIATGAAAAWASGGPNAIMVTSGPAEVETLAGTTAAYNYIETSATAGYATTVTTASATLTLPALYIGVGLTAYGSCAAPSAATCAGSLLTNIALED